MDGLCAVTSYSHLLSIYLSPNVNPARDHTNSVCTRKNQITFGRGSYVKNDFIGWTLSKENMLNSTIDKSVLFLDDHGTQLFSYLDAEICELICILNGKAVVHHSLLRRAIDPLIKMFII